MLDDNLVVREILCETRGKCSIGLAERGRGDFRLSLISPCCREVGIDPRLSKGADYEVLCNHCRMKFLVPLRLTHLYSKIEEFPCSIPTVVNRVWINSWVSCLIHEYAEVTVV